MIAMIMPWIALALSTAGFAALAAAMERHQRHNWSCAKHYYRRAMWRISGGASLIGSLVASLIYAGWGTGLILWIGLQTVCALTVAMVLACRSKD